MVPASATPQGLACFTMTHAGASNWRTHSSAVSLSAMLLYDSSLPCICFACVTDAPMARGSRIERGLLMRVLAIAQDPRRLRNDRFRSSGNVGELAADRAGEVRGHHGIVLRGVRERLGRELLAHGDMGRALIGRQLVEQAAVIAGIDHHRDRGVILRRRAHHGRAADIDVLDRIVVAAVGPRHGRGKRVEIDREQIDRLDAVLAHDVLIDAAAPQQAAVNLRVQGFHPAAHDLGKAGVFGDFLDRNAVAHQQFGGAAGGQQLDAALLQFARKLDDPSFIGNAEQCAAYGREQCLSSTR